MLGVGFIGEANAAHPDQHDETIQGAHP